MSQNLKTSHFDWFYCRFCGLKFPHRDDVIKHKKLRHGDIIRKQKKMTKDETHKSDQQDQTSTCDKLIRQLLLGNDSSILDICKQITGGSIVKIIKNGNSSAENTESDNNISQNISQSGSVIVTSGTIADQQSGNGGLTDNIVSDNVETCVSKTGLSPDKNPVDDMEETRGQEQRGTQETTEMECETNESEVKHLSCNRIQSHRSVITPNLSIILERFMFNQNASQIASYSSPSKVDTNTVNPSKRGRPKKSDQKSLKKVSVNIDNVYNLRGTRKVRNFKCTECSLIFPEYDMFIEHRKVHVILFKGERKQRKILSKRDLRIHKNLVESPHSPATTSEQRDSDDYGNETVQLKKRRHSGLHNQKPSGIKESEIHKQAKVMGIVRKFVPNDMEEWDKAVVRTPSLPQFITVQRDQEVTSYLCIICNKTMSTVNEAENHISSHTGQLDIKCVFCFQTFPNYKNLESHEQSCHSDIVEQRRISLEQELEQFGSQTKQQEESIDKIETNEAVSVKDQEKMQQFSKSFNGHSELSLFVTRRVVDGTICYSCNFCLKLFKFMSTAKLHVRCHTGELNYKRKGY